MRAVPATTCRGRHAVAIENDDLRVTVLAEGGHIAEVLDKRTGINPLWSPPWNPIEPSRFDAAAHAELFGRGSDARLLAGIAGHNLCLDIFGGPSDDEAAAGLTAHGEGSVVAYEIAEFGRSLCMRADFPLARINVERRLELDGRAIQVEERVESPAASIGRSAGRSTSRSGRPFLKKASPNSAPRRRGLAHLKGSSAPPTISRRRRASSGPWRRGSTVVSPTCASSPTQRCRAPTPRI